MSYRNKFAEYYDLFYASKDYTDESNFISKTINHYIQKDSKDISILELACGTGEHSIRLAAKGYQIIGTDISESMIEQAKKKIKGNESNISFKTMNMEMFDSSLPKFDVVICLFDSIGYLLTNEKILKTLNNIKSTLRESALFIMEFWNAGAMLRSFEPRREKFFNIDNKIIKRISNTSIDYFNQLAEVNYSVYEKNNNDANFRLITEELHRNRYFLIQEMESLLHQAGLTCIQYLPEFKADGVITEDTWHTVAICKKSDL